MSDNEGRTSSEGEGEDIDNARKKRSLNPEDDSSEEEEDDPDEVRRVQAGFIVDEDEDEDEASGSGDERSRSADSADNLSDDDLDLLAENTGSAFPRPSKSSKSKPKKLLRRRQSPAASEASNSGSASEDMPNTDDLARIFEDMPRKRREAAAAEEEMDVDEDDDGLGDFIEEDEFDEDGGEAAERARERKKAKKQAMKKGKAGKRGGEGGISKAAWDDIYDIFGNGDEYDWALEGEDEMLAGNVTDLKIEDVFEPSEIQARHLTESDNLIRLRDIPERHQLMNSTLSSSPTYILGQFPKFPDIKLAAKWISSRISARTKNTFLSIPIQADELDSSRPNMHLKFLTAVEKALGFMFLEHFEVPFVWEHRRDYLVHYATDSQGHIIPKGMIELITRPELWKIFELGLKYRNLMKRKQGLLSTWEKLKQRLKDQTKQHTEEATAAPISIDGEAEGEEEKKPIREEKVDWRLTYFEEFVISPMGTAEESVEGVVDGADWLGIRFMKEFKEMKEDEDLDEETRLKEGRYKRPSAQGPKAYLNTYRDARLSNFVKAAGLPIEEAVSKNLFMNEQEAIHADIELFPEDYAEQFIDGKMLTDVTMVLRAARGILVQDCFKNPHLRRIVRDYFREQGLVSVYPTEAGLTKIDDFHPYNSFKYLKEKSITELAQSARFLHILEAERNNLVKVSFTLSEQTQVYLEESLFQAWKSNETSDSSSSAWNAFRRTVIKEAWEKELIPMGAKWAREWLRDEVENFVAGSCASLLEKAANQSPFRPKEYEKGASPSVLAVSHGKGDRNDAVMCVFIDEQGRVRESTKIETLDEKKPWELEKMARQGIASKTLPTDEFKALITRRQPSLIVVGGFRVGTHRLMERVKTLVLELAQAKVDKENEASRPGGSIPWGEAAKTELELEMELKDASIPVTFVPDDVARLYQHSDRAQREFGLYPPTSRYCVGLGRYAQSPIHEYCALGSDIVAITFDDYSQKLVPQEKLLLAFERVLVNIVNDNGVVINDVIGDSYQHQILNYVSGFGPRKAQQLIRDVVRIGGFLTNRLELFNKHLLTPVMFDNAAGFLEIPHEMDELELSPENPTTQPDPLDSTRIHPDDYEFARKMAENALELDDEDVADDHPSKSVVKLMLDDSPEEKLNELNLDDFADNLRDIRGVEKRFALNVIKDEMASPGRDRRADFQVPTPWQIVTMLTGESETTLVPGFLVSGRVTRVHRGEVNIRLDSGIEAIVDKTYVSDEPVNSCDEVVKADSYPRAVIIAVYPEKLLIELSLRNTELAYGDAALRKVTPDEPFDRERAEADAEAAQRKKRTDVDRLKRQIDHPNFFNMNVAEAEQELASQHRGDVIIRPSSKGVDHLNVTWKVDDGLYQHIDVLEVDKPNPQSLGRILRVGGQYSYHDLDELIVSHVKAVVRKMEELMNHEKFKGKNQEELDSYLKTFCLAQPGKAVYAFGLDRDHPGYFKLGYLDKSGGTIHYWGIKVNPGSYVIGNAEVGGMLELCNSFKTQFQKQQQQNKLISGGGGGRTPGMGARTPAVGSRTPGAMRTGMTPMHSGAAGSRSGMTPNPYAQAYTQAQAAMTQGMVPGGYPGYSQPQPYAYPNAAGGYPVGGNYAGYSVPQSGAYGAPQSAYNGYPVQGYQAGYEDSSGWGSQAAAAVSGGFPTAMATTTVPSSTGGPGMNPARMAMISSSSSSAALNSDTIKPGAEGNNYAAGGSNTAGDSKDAGWGSRGRG
ncbi:Transcription elongation factor SPT6 [Phaffia rhodozyma]|uniref:Transcription elongation factor SPT6 n=1 Tax=Phaffia rhodozyma TaxID=264483 RepID=A0A0F7SV41_PHARH|nr:Transcription elongation factor SPT6 [Phaffia rhodozyma]